MTDLSSYKLKLKAAIEARKAGIKAFNETFILQIEENEIEGLRWSSSELIEVHLKLIETMQRLAVIAESNLETCGFALELNQALAELIGKK